MEITKREIITSIIIISILLIIGFFISEKITDSQNDKNAEYIKATHIDNTEIFQYGMDTNVGNAFVYGDLEAVDTASFEEIDGEYLYIEKVEEHYNRHTRTVTKTRLNSQGETETYTETEVYYSWDYYDSWNKHSKKIKFCGIDFDYAKIKLPSSQYIGSIGDDIFSKVRYKFYAVPVKHTGTIYTKLSNNTISDNTVFYTNKTIEEVLKQYTFHIGNIVFWIVWIIFIIAIVYGFYYLDNDWLE